LSLEGTFGGARVVRETTDVVSGLQASPRDSRFIWAIGARLGATASVSKRISVFGLLGVSLPLSNYEYVVREEARELGSGPPRAQLNLDLGASVDLL
jgi:hypothetical protein